MGMKALKALVVIMGIMIIAGVGVIIVTIVKRATTDKPAEAVVAEQKDAPASSPSVSAVPSPVSSAVAPGAVAPGAVAPGAGQSVAVPFAVAEIGDISLNLPEGSRILSSAMEGERLMLVIGGDDGIREVRILSLQDGSNLARIR